MRSLALCAAMAAAIALPACTSTDVLEPSALLGSQEQPQSDFPLQASPSGPATSPGRQVTALVTDVRVQFAPVVGASAAASAPLASRLATSAGSRGITLVQAGDASATHVMKGYFSTISETDGGTTVIYVWDVLDPAGTRVHRIQGQARAPAGAGDGWSSVEPSTMEAIADQTVDQLASWLVSRRG